MTGRRMVRCIRLLAVSAAVVCLGVWSGAGSILDSQAQESGAYGKTQSYNKDKNYEKDQNHKEAIRPVNTQMIFTIRTDWARAEKPAVCCF